MTGKANGKGARGRALANAMFDAAASALAGFDMNEDNKVQQQRILAAFRAATAVKRAAQDERRGRDDDSSYQYTGGIVASALWFVTFGEGAERSEVEPPCVGASIFTSFAAVASGLCSLSQAMTALDGEELWGDDDGDALAAAMVTERL